MTNPTVSEIDQAADRFVAWLIFKRAILGGALAVAAIKGVFKEGATYVIKTNEAKVENKA